MPLSERQRAILEFERTWWTVDEEKDLAIRRRFACAPDAYYEQLNEVLHDPDALAVDPLVVRRLLRLKDRRRRARLEGSTSEAHGGGRR